MAGVGAPEGLPLICRFLLERRAAAPQRALKFSPASRQATLLLVTPQISGGAMRSLFLLRILGFTSVFLIFGIIPEKKMLPHTCGAASFSFFLFWLPSLPPKASGLE